MPFADERAAAQDAVARAEGRRQLLHLTPHERHRRLLDDYARFYGAGQQLPVAAPRTDAQVLREQHRFIRSEEDDAGGSWEQRLAAKYYAKLFKEYCIADLSRYKEQKLGLRWRTQAEVVAGKGQFSCGAKRCDAVDGLASFEVNFAYEEAGEEKNAMVKMRVCPACATKLNYGRGERALRPCARDAEDAQQRKRRRAEAAAPHARSRPAADEGAEPAAVIAAATAPEVDAAAAQLSEAEHWGAPVRADAEPSREEEFDAYFAGMFA